jgi:hypothetical protein
MTLAIIAALLLPYAVTAAEADNPTVTDEPSAVAEITLPEEAPLPEPGVTSGESSITSAATGGPLSLPNANPVHRIELAYNTVNVTYPNGETAAHDNQYIPFIINGTLIDSDVILVNNRTLVPLRVLTEVLGGSVEWDDATRAVTIYNGYDVIKMAIGNNTVIINDVETAIDVPPLIYNNYTYLPLRFVAEALGARVSYNTGEYDRTTMKFNSYMMAQGFSANAVVDQYDPSWPILSEFQAESTVMSMSRDLFNQFMEQNNAAHPDKDYTAKYNFINYNIDNTRVVGSVSRYYVVESFSLFLFDKYTGIIYTIGSDAKSSWVRRYAEGDPENFKMIANNYYIN